MNKLDKEQREAVRELGEAYKGIINCTHKIYDSANRFEAGIYADNKFSYKADIKALEEKLGLNEKENG